MHFKKNTSRKVNLSFFCRSVSGLFALFVLSLALAGAQALTPAHYLTLSDVGRLQNLLSQRFTDLDSAYYSVVGLSKLGATIPDHEVRKIHFVMIQSGCYTLHVAPRYLLALIKKSVLCLQGICQFLKSQLDPMSIDSLFFAAETSQAISGCEVCSPRLSYLAFCRSSCAKAFLE